MKGPPKNKLSPKLAKALLATLKTRFEKNMDRHATLKWPDVELRLGRQAAKLWSLHEMEQSGGQPDVVSWDPASGDLTFVDCVPETPMDRRSICYDHEALETRKSCKPHDSAMNMAKAMGIELLNEDQYRKLQALGKFDSKTSSWILTPPDIRRHGGALFGDRRYDHVFIYHNGAQSYYSGRAFRGILKI